MSPATPHFESKFFIRFSKKSSAILSEDAWNAGLWCAPEKYLDRFDELYFGHLPTYL